MLALADLKDEAYILLIEPKYIKLSKLVGQHFLQMSHFHLWVEGPSRLVLSNLKMFRINIFFLYTKT